LPYIGSITILKINLLLLLFSASFSSYSQDINVEKLESLGSLIWYDDKCNNTRPLAKLEILNILEQDFSIITEDDIDFNDDLSNGKNKAFIAGCARIKDKILEAELGEYLICSKKDYASFSGEFISGCVEEGED
jgi:hypothetical protein